MPNNDFHAFLVALLIVILVIWCIVALPIGRVTMRGDLLKDGYHVVDMNEKESVNRTIGKGRWVIEIWRDGWVAVER